MMGHCFHCGDSISYPTVVSYGYGYIEGVVPEINPFPGIEINFDVSRKRWEIFLCPTCAGVPEIKYFYKQAMEKKAFNYKMHITEPIPHLGDEKYGN